MPAPKKLKFDEISYWSEIKLQILKEYAKAYNAILLKNHLHPIYIDGFAGAGHHMAKGSSRLIAGSPRNALDVRPAFEKLHFIDLDEPRAQSLREMCEGDERATVYEGDCNKVLLSEIFPEVKYEQRRRALCILDPYGLTLDWQVIEAAGKMETIEIFLNFPVMDMNRNVLWHDADGIDESDRQRMTAFWGDQSWKCSAYEIADDLFGNPRSRKEPNYVIAEAFRTRLKQVAAFKFVPKPIPMRNSNGAVLYYLFFAAQKEPANKIVTDIFTKYAQKGMG